MTTGTPSLLRCTSSSIASAPSSSARRNEASVFSGAVAIAPRWPITTGRPRACRNRASITSPTARHAPQPCAPPVLAAGGNVAPCLERRLASRMSQLRQRVLLRLWRDLPLPYWSRRLYLRLTTASVLLGASAVILDERGQVLVLEHTYRRAAPWGLPGGYLSKGEDPQQGVRREVREETGLDVEVGELLDAGLFVPDELDLAYHCRVVGGQLRLGPEIRRAEYRPLERLGEILPKQQTMLERMRHAGRLPAAPRAPVPPHG